MNLIAPLKFESWDNNVKLANFIVPLKITSWDKKYATCESRVVVKVSKLGLLPRHLVSHARRQE